MCQHRSIIGDNYGTSCQDCGEILSGYGYGGWFGCNLKSNILCKHKFIPYEEGEICIYCQRERSE